MDYYLTIEHVHNFYTKVPIKSFWRDYYAGFSQFQFEDRFKIITNKYGREEAFIETKLAEVLGY